MSSVDDRAAMAAMAMRPAHKEWEQAKKLRNQADECRRAAKRLQSDEAVAQHKQAVVCEARAKQHEELGQRLAWDQNALLDALWSGSDGAQKIARTVATSFAERWWNKRSETVDDVLTPLLLHLQRSLAHYHRGRKFEAWWRQVVENWLKSHLRGQAPEYAEPQEFEEEATADTTVSQLEASELRECVLRYCEDYVNDGTPKGHARRADEVQAFLWKTFLGVRNGELAQRFNVTPACMSQRVKRVRDDVVRRLEGDGWLGEPV